MSENGTQKFEEDKAVIWCSSDDTIGVRVNRNEKFYSTDRDVAGRGVDILLGTALELHVRYDGTWSYDIYHQKSGVQINKEESSMGVGFKLHIKSTHDLSKVEVMKGEVGEFAERAASVLCKETDIQDRLNRIAKSTGSSVASLDTDRIRLVVKQKVENGSVPFSLSESDDLDEIARAVKKENLAREFGRIVGKAMQQQGMTPDELASQTSLTRSQVIDLSGGRYHPSQDQRREVESVLGVDLTA